MSLSRDRLARPIDISTLIPNAARRVGLIVDEPGLHRGLRTPVRNEPGSSGAGDVDSPVGTGMPGIRTAGRGLGWNSRRSPMGRGYSRTRPLRRGRARDWVAGSGLRSWYPRTPLRDVTAVVRAIERRRAREANERESQTDNDEGTSDPIHNSERTNVLVWDENERPSVQPEHEASFKTPLPAFAKKPQRSPTSLAWSIVATIACEKPNESMTPEKKLLNSIEKVREVLKEEERRMQNTPAAKRADRAKKMRTLMSMR